MLLEKYQKLLSKDIENIISYFFENYEVTKNGMIIDKDVLITHFLGQQEILQCCGIVQSGSRCTRSVIKGYLYCKTHILKNQKNEHTKQLSNPIEFIKPITTNKPLDKKLPNDNLEKIFTL